MCQQKYFRGIRIIGGWGIRQINAEYEIYLGEKFKVKEEEGNE